MMKIIPLLLPTVLVPYALAGEAEFKEIVKKIEGDALEFARLVEDLHDYSNRCDVSLLESCHQGMYHECLSKLPSPQCLVEDGFVIPACGDGVVCSALWDFTTSNIRIPDQVATNDDFIVSHEHPRFIESTCSTRDMDIYLREKFEEDRDFWKQAGARPSFSYFGSETGAFRIYPGRHSAECGKYDPRIRPWFIAASSGPKNIIMILDTSGSMLGLRLDLMKDAAKQIVRTLTVGDRVAIIEFNSRAKIHSDQNKYVYTATADNKKELLSAIDGFEAVGSTNFISAFSAAFKVMQDSYAVERHVPCNTAILFLTDGEATSPDEYTVAQRENETMSLVTTGLRELENRLGYPVFLFTYSISESQAAAHRFPRQLACGSTDHGIWSKIVDVDEIVESLTSYYSVFSLGLGSGDNADFTAWVEPYAFATGGIMGTTVSAPVYDRTIDPPQFLGAVGVDFPLVAIDKTLDGDSQKSLDEIVKRSKAVCPALKLGQCALESFRRRGLAGNEALCTNSCNETDFVTLEAEKCPTINDYPQDLIIDRSFKSRSYTERTCCKVGINEPTSECPVDDGASIGASAIVGIVVGAIALCCCGFFIYYLQGRRNVTIPASTVEQRPVTSPLPPSMYDSDIFVLPCDIPVAKVVAMAPPEENPQFRQDDAA